MHFMFPANANENFAENHVEILIFFSLKYSD